MAKIIAFRYLIAFAFQIFYFRALDAYPNLSFSFTNFGKDSNFESQIALYGDAMVANGGSLQISGSSIPSAGKVMSKEPVKLVGGNPKIMVSFSTYFSFSMTPAKGDGLAFVLVPVGYPLNVFDGGPFGLLSESKMKFLGVEFDTLMDEKYDDLNDNHVGVDIDNLASVMVYNVSLTNLRLNSNEKLQVWIDYEAALKRLEVRMSRFGDVRPLNPLLSFSIDLAHMWKEEDVVVGISASSRNSSQNCNLFSWGFSTRTLPHWMHSEPLDPQAFPEKIEAEPPSFPKKNDCALRILSALIIGIGCGALGTSIILFLWSIYGPKPPVVPEDYAIRPGPGQFEYKKFEVVVVDKPIKDGKK